MANTKAPHHRGSYQTQAKRITTAANLDPTTRCWRCRRTLTEHPPHKNGRPAYWTAGHVIDGAKDSPLLPEASTCNFAAGARLTNRRRKPRQPNVSRAW